MTVAYEFEPGTLESLGSLVEWANRPENLWHVGTPPPGKLEDRRRLLSALEITKEGVRLVVIAVVFTVDRQAFGVCRHASVSMTTGKGPATELPSRGMIGMVCKELGFQGDFRTWIAQESTEHRVIEVLEPVANN